MDTNESERKLTDRQRQVIPFLLESGTILEASRLAGVSNTVIYNWLKDPFFRDYLESQRSEILTAAVNRLKFGTVKAANVLLKLLDSDSEVIQRGAANDILTHTTKFKELLEFEQRLTALEKIGGDR